MKTQLQSPIEAAMMKAHADSLGIWSAQSAARAFAEQQQTIRDTFTRLASSQAFSQMYAEIAAAQSSVRSLHELIGRSTIESIARTLAETDHVARVIAREALLRESMVHKVAKALLEREANAQQEAALHGQRQQEVIQTASVANTNNQLPAESAPEFAIEMPPGIRMMALARAVFPSKTIEFVFEPIVADYQYEIFKALKNKQDEQTLRTIRVRCWMAFLVAVVCQLASGVGRIIRAWKGT